MMLCCGHWASCCSRPEEARLWHLLQPEMPIFDVHPAGITFREGKSAITYATTIQMGDLMPRSGEVTADSTTKSSQCQGARLRHYQAGLCHWGRPPVLNRPRARVDICLLPHSPLPSCGGHKLGWVFIRCGAAPASVNTEAGGEHFIYQCRSGQPTPSEEETESRDEHRRKSEPCQSVTVHMWL